MGNYTKIKNRLRNTLPFLLLFFVGSCAQEQSAEVRQREEANRQYDRLSQAAGIYTGYVKNSETQWIPISLEVLVTKNPTNTGRKPVMSVGMRVGLFGGVTIASTSSAFDWGSRELIVSFNRLSNGTGNGVTSGGGVLEIRGIIDDGKLTQGVLIGPHIGKMSLFVDKGTPDVFDAKTEWFYEIQWNSPNKVPDPRGILAVKSKALNQPSPGTSDLPFLPGLDTSLTFESFAAIPQNAKQVLYDPLLGTLDLQFTDNTWLRTENIFLPKDEEKKPFPISGNLSLGGVILRKIELRPLDKFPNISRLPPVTYVGTYQGTPKSLAYKAVAYLNYLGGSANNKSDLPFALFPQMQLEVDVCNGADVFSQAILKLDALDYLNHKGLFHRLTTEQNPIEIDFKNDWSYLEGTYLETSQHVGGDRPKVRLKPDNTVSAKGCATPFEKFSQASFEKDYFPLSSEIFVP